MPAKCGRGGTGDPVPQRVRDTVHRSPALTPPLLQHSGATAETKDMYGHLRYSGQISPPKFGFASLEININ